MPPRKPKASPKPKRQTKAASEGIASAPVVKGDVSVLGRPTLYRPEFCEMVIEWGKQGKSKTWMAAEIGIAKQTLYDWEEAHPDFLDATRRAVTMSQRWWEDAGQSGMQANLFNSTVWAKNMSCRFRDDWADRQEVTGAGGGSLSVSHSIEFHVVDPSQDQG